MVIEEFDRQLKTLLRKHYPSAAGLSEPEFVRCLEPLRASVATLPLAEPDFRAGTIPFVIVVPSRVVSTEHAVGQLERQGKPGVISMRPVRPQQFTPIDEVRIPNGNAYLLVGIDRGDAARNLTPERALEAIRQAGRSPLTIDEGVAVLTQHPDFLLKNHCFSLLASRRADRRVPALWISAGAPKLGWCWDGNPHTWLGSAWCLARVGA